jgi:hypothetical protein
MSVGTQLSGPYGSLPLNLLLASEFQSLSSSARGVVLLVVARQNLHGGWSYTTRNLADDLGLSTHTARQAVTEANRAGILAVKDERDCYGVVSSRWYSVPSALPAHRQTIHVAPKKSVEVEVEDDTTPLSEIQTGGLSEIQTGPLSEIQTPTSIRENDQEQDPPNPPLPRGATDRSRSGSRKRKAPRIVDHPQLGVVDLSRVADPRLRNRDQRRIDALLAERAAVEAAELAEKAQQAAVTSILGSVPSRLRSMTETIEARLAASILRTEHPAREAVRALQNEAADLWARAGWTLATDEATALVEAARETLDGDALAETLSLLDAQEATERAKQVRIQPMLVELTGTLAGIESIVHELTMAMVTQRKIGDASVRPVRARVFAVADRAKAARARLNSEWADEAELANVGAMLVELSDEAQGLRPLLG